MAAGERHAPEGVVLFQVDCDDAAPANILEGPCLHPFHHTTLGREHEVARPVVRAAALRDGHHGHDPFVRSDREEIRDELALGGA